MLNKHILHFEIIFSQIKNKTDEDYITNGCKLQWSIMGIRRTICIKGLLP